MPREKSDDDALIGALAGWAATEPDAGLFAATVTEESGSKSGRVTLGHNGCSVAMLMLVAFELLRSAETEIGGMVPSPGTERVLARLQAAEAALGFRHAELH